MCQKFLLGLILFAAGPVFAQQAPQPPASSPILPPARPITPSLTPAPVTGYNASPVRGFSQQPVNGFRTVPQAGPVFQVPPPARENLMPPFSQNPVGNLAPAPVGGFTPVAPVVVPQPNVIAEPAPVFGTNLPRPAVPSPF